MNRRVLCGVAAAVAGSAWLSAFVQDGVPALQEGIGLELQRRQLLDVRRQVARTSFEYRRVRGAASELPAATPPDVARALRDNMPWDEFTRMNLAGDLLPEAGLEGEIASGFNRLHVSTAEGGSIVEEVLVRNVVDRVSTVGTIFCLLYTSPSPRD